MAAAFWHGCWMRIVSTVPELLEARIAPALILLPADTLAIPHDRGGQGTGALGSVLLSPGDVLALDVNADGRFGAGDVKLAAVSASRALFFLTDRNGDGGWDADEITGVSVGHGIKATIFTDIAGSIVTSLNAKGQHVEALPFSDIADLTVKGHVAGGVYASGSIRKLTIGTAPGLELAAQEVGAGVSVADASLGTISESFSFSTPAGHSGGSVSHVTLIGGAKVVSAGFGYSGRQGTPGGDLRDIVLVQAPGFDYFLTAGPGGNSEGAQPGGRAGATSGIRIHALGFIPYGLIAGASGGVSESGPGGAGGVVENISVTAPVAADVLAFGGGMGGRSDNGRSGAGGAVRNVQIATPGGEIQCFGGWSDVSRLSPFTGGNVSNIVVRSETDYFGGIFIGGGMPDSTRYGLGGHGGNVSGVLVDVAGHLDAGVDIFGGDGGFSKSGTGGSGGGVTNVIVRAGQTSGDIQILGGSGGSAFSDNARYAGRGGPGGSIAGLAVSMPGDAANFLFSGGPGGSGQLVSGAGGNVGTHTVRVGSLDAVMIAGGPGGETKGRESVAGGAGGSVLHGSWFIANGMSSDFEVRGGCSGSAPRRTSAGGSVEDFRLHADGPAKGLFFRGGDGGAAQLPGDGGSLRELSIVLARTATILDFTAGQGGSQLPGAEPLTTGQGGAGGNIFGSSVRVLGAVAGEAAFIAGTGGVGVVGGTGGSILGLSGSFSTAQDITVIAGDGAAGISSGAGGHVGNLHLVAGDLSGSFFLRAGFSDIADSGFGGRGGSIFESTMVLGHTPGGILLAGDGGTSRSGIGGDGGSILSCTLTTPDIANFLVAAGFGGFGNRRDGVDGVIMP